MKPFSEIVEAHMEDGGFDIQAIVETAAKELGGLPQLTVDQSFALLDAHYAYAVQYVGNIILGVAEAVGAIESADEANKDLALALELDKMRRLYELKRSLLEPKLVVPE